MNTYLDYELKRREFLREERRRQQDRGISRGALEESFATMTTEEPILIAASLYRIGYQTEGFGMRKEICAELNRRVLRHGLAHF